MKATIAAVIRTVTVTLLIYIACGKVFFGSGAGKIIFVHKVTTGVIRRVYIDHLNLAHISLLQELEHLQVVALYIEVFSGIPVYRVFRDRTEGLVSSLISLQMCSLLACPSELVTLIGTIGNGIA